MSTEPVITVRGLMTRFGEHIIHQGLDLDVYPGEILGIVGGSGSGKSVLLKEIIGLLRPAAGNISVLGHDPHTSDMREAESLRQRWGVLFQEGALFSALTVAQNVLMPMREFTNLSIALRRDLAAIKIALVGLPPEAADKRPSQLSGGMKKRVGLARALALDPEIVFLDEPTAGLDPISANAFDELILSLRRSLGLTVVMITHDLDTLISICDRVAVLVDKRIVVGTVEELRQHGHPWIRDYFGGPRGRAVMAHTGTGV
jgi:phospholipid/cholesterol/gamma-HCH transport system ATP-binding protein